MTLKKSRVVTPSTEYLINAVSYDHSRQYLSCSVIESGQLYRIIIIFKQVCTLSFKITFNSQKTWYFKALSTLTGFYFLYTFGVKAYVYASLYGCVCGWFALKTANVRFYYVITITTCVLIHYLHQNVIFAMRCYWNQLIEIQI